MNLTKKGRKRTRVSSHPISKNFTGRKFWGVKRSNSNFPRQGSSTTTTSDTTSGNGKVAGTAALSLVRMPYSGISCLFEKFSNFMQMQRRGGTVTRRTREDALRYREFEYSSYFSSPLSIIVEGTVSIVSRRKQGLGG